MQLKFMRSTIFQKSEGKMKYLINSICKVFQPSEKKNKARSLFHYLHQQG